MESIFVRVKRNRHTRGSAVAPEALVTLEIAETNSCAELFVSDSIPTSEISPTDTTLLFLIVAKKLSEFAAKSVLASPVVSARIWLIFFLASVVERLVRVSTKVLAAVRYSLCNCCRC